DRPGREARGRAEADDAGHVERARADALLLPATFGLRLETQPRLAVAPHVESSDTLRPVHLVGGEAHEVHVPRAGVDGNAAEGLDRVAVEDHGLVAAEGADLLDRLARAGPVVGGHP